MVKVGVDIRGVSQVARLFKEYEREVGTAANTAIGRGALIYLSEVKESIAGRKRETKSWKTGTFINSVHAERVSQGVWRVLSNVTYAPFLEYGTRYFAARNHFRNSMKRARPKINSLLRKELQQAGIKVRKRAGIISLRLN